jgi:8-oxo-dGTP pyrophosphatase MutT (NUDIX family)
MQLKRPPSPQPLPANAKKVFEGEIFSVYQWPQQMYDGSTATFEKLVRGDTVSVIPVTTDHQILLLDQEQPGIAPFKSLAGGRIDLGEDPETAALRELKEETGCTCQKLDLWYSTQLTSKIDWAIYVFIARGCQKVSELDLDAGEKIAVRAVSFEEFIQLLYHEDFRDDDLALRALRLLNHPNGKEQLHKILFSV